MLESATFGHHQARCLPSFWSLCWTFLFWVVSVFSSDYFLTHCDFSVLILTLKLKPCARYGKYYIRYFSKKGKTIKRRLDDTLYLKLWFQWSPKVFYVWKWAKQLEQHFDNYFLNDIEESDANSFHARIICDIITVKKHISSYRRLKTWNNF